MRSYDNDLNSLLQKTEDILRQAQNLLRALYDENGLKYDGKGMSSVKGDIYSKVLGSYIQNQLGYRIDYEQTLVGRIRADFVINDLISVEVKSMGVFTSVEDLAKRFERIVKAKPNMKHCVVGFHHTHNWVSKIKKRLAPLGVEHFMMTDSKNEIYGKELERFVNFIKENGV